MHLQTPSDAFEAFERQIVLTALKSAQVRPMNTELVGEGFLAEAASATIGREISPQDRL
jgi:hypothetical protein